MEDAFFLTEIRRYDYVGSALANAVIFQNKIDKELELVKEKFPNYNWETVKLDELYNLLNTQEQQFIVVSSKAKAYKHALEIKYPQAKIQQFDDINQTIV